MLGAAIVTTDSVAYAWANPDGACDPSNISAYQRRLNNGMVVDIVLQNEAGPLGSDNIPGLTPFTNYTIEVRYVCADGRMSAFSAPLMFQTPQGSEQPVERDTHLAQMKFSVLSNCCETKMLVILIKGTIMSKH